MKATIDITPEQRNTLLALLRRFIPGVAVWAYGSRVKWTARPNSDLDLVAFTTPAQSYLVSELKEALGESNIPFLVDLHVWNEVPERFHEIIRNEYVVLQEAEEQRLGGNMAAILEELPLPDELPVIPDSWSYKSLGDLVEERGVCYGIVQPGSEVTDGVPIVRVNNIRNGRIDTSDMMKVDPEIEAKFQRSRLRGGEVLLTLVGTLGETAIVPDNFRGWNVARAVGVIPVRKDPGSLWVSICLRSSFVQHCIRMWATTTVQATFNLRDLAKLPIPIPPKDTRKAIAHILGTLDDKIELNRRMNATLEEMARALFQSWFVDFDPVRAKLDGRKPAGLDAATAALFPTHFQDSPLGHIPQGWEVCPLADKIELLSGGTPKTGEPDYWDGGIPWFSVKDAPTETDVWVIHTEKSVTKLGISNSAAQIFPEKTTIITARGTVGKLALTGIPMAMNQSCYGVRGITGYGDYFTYYALRSATAQLQQRTHGTVFDTITRQTFETLNCIFPPPKLTAAFDLAAEPLLEQIRANLHQSRTLATIRDALLPLLMSGKISVPNGQLPEEELV